MDKLSGNDKKFFSVNPVRKRESYGWICKQMRTTARRALPRTYRDTSAK